MAEKRVSVRLAAVGGRQVRAELEGVGEAGSRGFGRLSREMEAVNARLAAFSRRVRVAAAAPSPDPDVERVGEATIGCNAPLRPLVRAGKIIEVISLGEYPLLPFWRCVDATLTVCQTLSSFRLQRSIPGGL